MNFDLALTEHRLYIDSEYEQTASLFCNIGKKTSEKKGRFLLNTWFEGYLYVLLLGIKINQREKYSGSKNDKSPIWKPNFLKQYKYAISLLLSKKDILNELNLLNYDSIISSETDAKQILNDVKIFIRII